MITVKIEQNGITVSGHANTAPKGRDLACAAVSVLTQTLIDGLREVAGMDIQGIDTTGYVRILWPKQHLNPIGEALVETFRLGLEGINGTYNCIRFQ